MCSFRLSVCSLCCARYPCSYRLNRRLSFLSLDRRISSRRTMCLTSVRPLKSRHVTWWFLIKRFSVCQSTPWLIKNNWHSRSRNFLWMNHGALMLYHQVPFSSHKASRRFWVFKIRWILCLLYFLLDQINCSTINRILQNWFLQRKISGIAIS